MGLRWAVDEFFAISLSDAGGCLPSRSDSFAAMVPIVFFIGSICPIAPGAG